MIVSHETIKKAIRSRLYVTRSTTVKFVNALNKLPLKLSLSYQGLSMFSLYIISNPTMEEIGTIKPKYQPLQFLWHHLCSHAQETTPWHPFMCLLTNSTFIVSTIIDLKLIDIHGIHMHYKLFPYIFTHALFFSNSSFYTFCGLVGACVNHGSFLFIHSLVCQISLSF